MEIVFEILLIIFIFFIGYKFFCKNSIKKIKQELKVLENKKEEYEEILSNYEIVKTKEEIVQKNLFVLKEVYDNTKKTYDERINELNNQIVDLENKMDESAEQLNEEYENHKQELEKEYEILLVDLKNNYSLEQENYQQKIQKINNVLLEMSNKMDSAVEAEKRQEEIKEKENFYKINISDIDKEEIIKLKSVSEYLRDKEPLNKIIWKVYYEKPTADLIGRVVGKQDITGIYKITNLINKKCYVGQAVNISNRWKQHIKRGLGAETPTKNKLYPAMMEYGVENFSFEIIEKCDISKLNDLEDYWQDYFHAKDYGYSIK